MNSSSKRVDYEPESVASMFFFLGLNFFFFFFKGHEDDCRYVKLVKLFGATNRYLLTPGVISNSE